MDDNIQSLLKAAHDFTLAADGPVAVTSGIIRGKSTVVGLPID